MSISSIPKYRRLLWSPSKNENDNRFLVGSNDLRLYEWNGPSKAPTMLAVHVDLPLMRTFAWNPASSHEIDDLLGIGLSNGRVRLIRAGSVDSEILGELSPRHSRSCNVVQFSYSNPSIVASGLEKVRNDYCLLLWDIDAQSSDGSSYTSKTPLQKYGSSESVTSISFLPNQPHSLISGMGSRWVRLYDIRESQPSIVIGTKAVYGIQPDPFNPSRFLTYSDENICFWDMRMPNDPICILQESNMSRVNFSNHRSGFISGFSRDTRVIKLWDIRSSGSDSGSESERETICWRSRGRDSNFPLSSICWIPTVENCLLTISRTGLMGEVFVHEHQKHSYAPDNTICSATNNVVSIEKTITSIDTDIGSVMKNRVTQGYGMDPLKNLEIARKSGNNLLEHVWSWLVRMKSFSDSGRLTSGNLELSFYGILPLIRDCMEDDRQSFRPRKSSTSAKKTSTAMAYTAILNNQTSFTPITNSSMPDQLLSPSTNPTKNDNESYLQLPNEVNNNLGDLPFAAFDNTYRRLSLIIVADDELEITLRKLEKEKRFEKAAALALFHSNLQRCIRSLNMSGKSEYKLISTALAGFSVVEEPESTDRTSRPYSQSNMWREMCQTMSRELEHPYLRAIFSFISSGGKFNEVLENEEISIEDRIGIALRFLPRNELMKFLEQLSRRSIQSGDLEAIILTGFTFPDAIELFKKYINRTGDVQTAVLLLSHCPPRMFKEGSEAGLDAILQLERWGVVYSDFLDMLGLHHARCHFDIQARKVYALNNQRKPGSVSKVSSLGYSMAQKSNQKTPVEAKIEKALADNYKVSPQVFLRCNFCDASLSHDTLFAPVVGVLGSQKGRQNLNKFLPSPSSPSDQFVGLANVSSSQSMALSTKNRNHSCPNCKKPLPKCCICLLPMGMPLNSVLSDNDRNDPISFWFSWCQSCRHGGHAMHMNRWFEKHVTCPVSNCYCKCKLLDR